jgi:hypothetical protein
MPTATTLTASKIIITHHIVIGLAFEARVVSTTTRKAEGRLWLVDGRRLTPKAHSSATSKKGCHGLSSARLGAVLRHRRRIKRVRTCLILSALFALAAAGLWLWSALIYVPRLKSGWGTLVTDLKDGSTVLGEAPFYAALAKIAHLKAGAAGFAFLSAFTQAITLFLKSN